MPTKYYQKTRKTSKRDTRKLSKSVYRRKKQKAIKNSRKASKFF